MRRGNFIYTHLADAFRAHFAPPVVLFIDYNQWLDCNHTLFHWSFHLFFVYF
jgi:hypothetical protein